MDIANIVTMLEGKDTTQGYAALREAERLSEESAVLYPYMDRFMAMLQNDKTYIRVRGFRLFCKQARWDQDKLINKHLKEASAILQDEKPTAVRQALAALQEVALYKKELGAELKEQLSQIDPYCYKDTMHSLLAQDVQNVLAVIDGEKL